MELQRGYWRLCPECREDVDWCCADCHCCSACCECDDEEEEDDDDD